MLGPAGVARGHREDTSSKLPNHYQYPAAAPAVNHPHPPKAEHRVPAQLIHGFYFFRNQILALQKKGIMVLPIYRLGGTKFYRYKSTGRFPG